MTGSSFRLMPHHMTAATAVILGILSFTASSASAAPKVYRTDHAASATAYFSSNTLLGFHLMDEACNGKPVMAVAYTPGADHSRVNQLGSEHDLWDDTDVSNVTSMVVCTTEHHWNGWKGINYGPAK